jgi:flagellar basal-body rod protein FlgF
MDKGLYAASSAGLLAAKRLDVVANNLANVNTIGFKGERLATRQQEFGDTLASRVAGDSTSAQRDFDRTPGVIATGTTTDFSAGNIQYTGNPLDVALTKPNQFFTMNTPQGLVFTRAGNFSVNTEGALVASDGTPVNGDGGPINIPPGPVNISPNGTITSGTRVIARLQVVQVNDLNNLERVGGSRFRLVTGDTTAVDAPALAAQSVEMPNLQVIEGMVDMISASKAFEAYTKTAKTIEELNDRAIRTARSQG